MNEQLALPNLPMAVVPPRMTLDLDVHAVSRPAGTYTGDFYYTSRSSGGYFFALGDVAGKGLEAAVLTATIHEELEHRLPRAKSCDDIRATLGWIEQTLRPQIPFNRFVSMVFGRIDANNNLHLINAGHPPLLVVRQDGSVEALGPSGPVVGMIRDARWRSTLHRLRSGDSLVAFTDGALEALSPAGEELGLDPIVETLRRAGKHDARSITRAFTDLVGRHQAGSRPHDDLTILTLRMR